MTQHEVTISITGAARSGKTLLLNRIRNILETECQNYTMKEVKETWPGKETVFVTLCDADREALARPPAPTLPEGTEIEETPETIFISKDRRHIIGEIHTVVTASIVVPTTPGLLSAMVAEGDVARILNGLLEADPVTVNITYPAGNPPASEETK